jgi:hypothetical protein
MKSPVIVDLRNVYDPKRMRAYGFDYTSVGRKKVFTRERMGVS